MFYYLFLQYLMETKYRIFGQIFGTGIFQIECLGIFGGFSGPFLEDFWARFRQYSIQFWMFLGRFLGVFFLYFFRRYFFRQYFLDSINFPYNTVLFKKLFIVALFFYFLFFRTRPGSRQSVGGLRPEGGANILTRDRGVCEACDAHGSHKKEIDKFTKNKKNIRSTTNSHEPFFGGFENFDL